MKILILNWRDIKHPLAGGAEISTHEHAKIWVKEGYEVIQFSSSVPGRNCEETIDGIRIIRKGSHYTVHLHALFYYLKYFKNKIDLIIDEFHFIPFFTPFYAHTKIIAFIHETARELWFKNQPFPINIFGFMLEPLFFRLYKNIPFMTVSSSTKKDLVKFGIAENKIDIIHNGVFSINSKSLKEKDPTMLYLGRLAKDKGTEEAILAIKKVKEVFPKITLWIVGREEKKGYLQKLKLKANNFGMEKNIIFFNFVSEKKKFELLKRAWILIHPSFKEGWGLTVIEAATQGTPTVAYKTPGLLDSIIDEQTGLIAKIRKPDELAEKILRLLKNKELYDSLSKNAIIWSKEFSWKKSTEQSLELIKQIKNGA